MCFPSEQTGLDNASPFCKEVQGAALANLGVNCKSSKTAYNDKTIA